VPNTNALTIEQVLALLAAAPSRLAAMTSGLTPAQLRTAPEPDAWSANDVLAHLRACADVWGDAIAAILAEDHPTLRAVDPRNWMERTEYLAVDFRSSLRAFTAQRGDLLSILESLPPEAWMRTALVRGAGVPLERSVLSYAQRLGRHERTHLKQVARIIKAVEA
jgi:hypothetical protein